jgi:hypothetical protein
MVVEDEEDSRLRVVEGMKVQRAEIHEFQGGIYTPRLTSGGERNCVLFDPVSKTHFHSKR